LESTYTEGFHFSERYRDPYHPEFQYLHSIYTHVVPEFNGRATVPLLYDVTTGKIASNESLEIIRLFDNLGGEKGPKLFPEDLVNTEEWKEVQKLVLDQFPGASFKVSLTKTAEESQKASEEVNEVLQHINKRLEGKKFLFGDRVTVWDIRLFVTLVGLDLSAIPVFGANVNFKDHPNVNRFVTEFYRYPKVSETIRLEEIQEAHWKNYGIPETVPKGSHSLFPLKKTL